MNEAQSSRFKNLLLLGWLLAFGLPFVLITDLFPFHRFGMFARTPTADEEIQRYSIELKIKEKRWKMLKTGNPYFDKSYFCQLASDAFNRPEKRPNLAFKLVQTLDLKPDSIRLVKYAMNAPIRYLLIYPNR